LAHLTDLTQAQAKRLDDMTILVATLQRENAELRMAAMSGQQPPPPTNSVPISEIKDRPLPPNDPTTRTNQVEDKGNDPDQRSPLRNKRTARSRSSS
jgi:outer membrane protein TolC